MNWSWCVIFQKSESSHHLIEYRIILILNNVYVSKWMRGNLRFIVDSYHMQRVLFIHNYPMHVKQCIFGRVELMQDDVLKPTCNVTECYNVSQWRRNIYRRINPTFTFPIKSRLCTLRDDRFINAAMYAKLGISTLQQA